MTSERDLYKKWRSLLSCFCPAAFPQFPLIFHFSSTVLYWPNLPQLFALHMDFSEKTERQTVNQRQTGWSQINVFVLRVICWVHEINPISTKYGARMEFIRNNIFVQLQCCFCSPRFCLIYAHLQYVVTLMSFDHFISIAIRVMRYLGNLHVP